MMALRLRNQISQEQFTEYFASKSIYTNILYFVSVYLVAINVYVHTENAP